MSTPSRVELEETISLTDHTEQSLLSNIPITLIAHRSTKGEQAAPNLQDQYQSSIVFSFSLLVLSLERDAFAGQHVAFGLSSEVDHNGTSRSLL
jgi:hypothetical protein